MLHDANSGASRQAEHGNPLYDVLIDVPHITYSMYVVIANTKLVQ